MSPVHRILLLLVVIALPALLPPSGLAADAGPASVSLVAEPASVSWPDSPETSLKVNLESGPEGADFFFYLEPDQWGLTGVSGNPFFLDRATLEGPGELTLKGALISDPAPTSCFRGGFQGFRQDYRLTLPANTSTTLTVPVRATSSALSGMNSAVSLVIPGPDDNRIYRTGIPIEGPPGIRVTFGVRGESGTPGLITGKPFRLAGSTSPALPNALIRLIAEPRMYGFEGPRPVRHRLTTVTTDSQGRFRSGPVKLNREAVWVLHARPVTDSAHDDTPSCGPVVKSRALSRTAYYSDLHSRRFRSVSVRGTRLVGQKKVSLAFETRLVDHDGNPATVMRRISSMVGSAGCNRIGGQYWLKDGRLRWSRQLFSTRKGCAKPVDEWLTRTLQRGVKARMVRGRLVLTGKRGLRIILRQTGA